MEFKKLAGYFERLEQTPSRNVMVEILAELFREAESSEAEMIAYLTQGRVAASFEPVEFGMADKMVLKALTRAFEADDGKALELFKRTGDLGKVAEELSQTKHGKGLSIGEVFERLYRITQISGEGSVDQKVELLANLLKDNDGVTNRYLARIPVNNLRLGFSDMTLLEGLSWMIDGTKKHKPGIEAVYNIRPDLGFIAQTIREKGVKGLGRVKPKIGTPILVMRAERLITAEEILSKGEGRMAVEPKIDGFRLQLHFKRGVGEILEKDPVALKETKRIKEAAGIADNEAAVELFSRGLEQVTTMYPDIVRAAAREIKVEEVILDGEAIAYDPKTGKFKPFQETVQRKRKYDIEKFASSLPLKYIVFDCLYLNGESLLERAYLDRRKAIEQALGTEKSLDRRTLNLAPMEEVSDPKRLEKVFTDTLNKGLEGIMAKRLDGAYQAGARGWNWIKLKGSYQSKLADTVDAVVMGIDFGQGKRNAFGVGAFLIGVYDQATDTFKTISKVGTGLTDDEWRELKVQSERLRSDHKPAVYDVKKEMHCDVWLNPKMVGIFIADEVTKSPMHTAGYALRFPRLQGWRDDKTPRDATSLKELEKMVKLQR